jgi:hypothetical protein
MLSTQWTTSDVTSVRVSSELVTGNFARSMKVVAIIIAQPLTSSTSQAKYSQLRASYRTQATENEQAGKYLSFLVILNTLKVTNDAPATQTTVRANG